MTKINLVPAEILAKARQKQQTLQAAVIGAMVLALLLLASAGHFFRLKRLESQLASREATLKKLEVIVAKVEELERQAAAVRARLNVVNDLLKGRSLYPVFMSDFVKSVPPGVRVKSLNTVGGGSSVGPVKLTMTAEAISDEDIAAWVKRMEVSGRFSAAELGAITSSSTDRLFSFSLTVVYTPSL